MAMAWFRLGLWQLQAGENVDGWRCALCGEELSAIQLIMTCPKTREFTEGIGQSVLCCIINLEHVYLDKTATVCLKIMRMWKKAIAGNNPPDNLGQIGTTELTEQ